MIKLRWLIQDKFLNNDQNRIFVLTLLKKWHGMLKKLFINNGQNIICVNFIKKNELYGMLKN